MQKERKLLKRLNTITLAITLALSCNELAAKTVNEERQKAKIVLASEIEWEALNPARGDKSPQAGTLWGDRKGTSATAKECEPDCPLCSNGSEPTGFLAKFVDGFSSPPHIHNVTYRAVVISGLIHNDDPDAAHMWMPPGSFWTQPKGEVHITAAKGESTVALVEIDKGPYLVMPPEEAFDSGERPINIHASNIVWVTPPGLPTEGSGPKIAYLWGDLKEGFENGTFIKLPAGFSVYIHSTGSSFRMVTIKGQPEYFGDEKVTLSPGSYLSSSGDAMHKLQSNVDHNSVFYVRSNGSYRIIPSGITE